MKEAERISRADLAKAAALAEKIEKDKEKQKDVAEAELSGFFSEIAGSSASTSSGQTVTEEASKADNDDDLLSGFFSEVEGQKNKVEKVVVDETFIHEKYTNEDLGDRKQQYERIMAKNYEWRNLNPYFVLQLGTDATEEDIKQRYFHSDFSTVISTFSADIIWVMYDLFTVDISVESYVTQTQHSTA